MKKQIILIVILTVFILTCLSSAYAADPGNSQIIKENSTSKELKKTIVTGQVTDCVTKKPFPGVKITVTKNGKNVAYNTTKKDGTYIISFLSNYNKFNVTASHTGHYSVTKEVTRSASTNFLRANFQLGNTIYVNVNTGNDNWDGTSPTHTSGNIGPKKHISAGISASSSGGNLSIANGTYKENKLYIKKNLNISGTNQTKTIIDAYNKDNPNLIFWIYSGYTVKIQNLTMTNGEAHGTVDGQNGDNGGAIYNQGTLTVENCVFTKNRARNGNDADTFHDAGHGGYGGAIYNNDGCSLTIKNCSFNLNFAGKGGEAWKGKVSIHESGAGGNGGAIYNKGTLKLQNSNFTENRAGNGGNGVSALNGSHGGYGGAIYNQGTLNITGCYFKRNVAGSGGYAVASYPGHSGDGGAIYNTNSLTITNTEIVANHAGRSGITIKNGAYDGGNGGGIYNSGNLQIDNCKIHRNHAGDGRDGLYYDKANTFPGNGGCGGGIYNTGTLKLTNSNIYLNRAGHGGSIMSKSKHTPKSGGHGGALYNTGTSTIENCKIYDNSAGNGGRDQKKSSASNGGNGGAFYNKGTLTVYECEIRNNKVGVGRNGGSNGNGGGIYYSSGKVTVNFCRILNNTPQFFYSGTSSTSVNLQNNWWGSNNEPKDQVKGNNIQSSYYNPWLILRIFATPTSVYTHRTSHITADLIMNNAGENTLIKYAMYVSDGIQMVYKTNIGSLIPGIRFTRAGGSNTTFFASNANGNAKIQVTVDNQVVSTQIQVNPQADIGVKKTVNNNRPNVGDTVTFTVTVRNRGPNDATGIKVSDKMPSGFSGVVITPSLGTSYSGGVWTIPALANGATATLTMTGVVTSSIAGVTTTNTATKTHEDQHDPDPINNRASCSIYVPMADIHVAKTADNNHPNLGDTVKFTVTVINDGPDNATNVQIYDVMPIEFIGVVINPSVGSYDPVSHIWTIPTLNSGKSATLTMSGILGVIVPTITNTATKTHEDQYDPSPADDTVSVTIGVAEADVDITKVVNKARANVGENVIFTITVRNRGPNPASGLVFIDKLPLGLKYIQAIPSVGTISQAANYILWNLGSLANGQSAVLTITTEVISPGNLENIVRKVHGDQYDQDVDYATASVYAPEADITITNTPNNSQVNVGKTAKFTVRVRNNGPDDATNVVVTDVIPIGFTAQVTKGTIINGVWNIGTLKAGEEAVLTLTGILQSYWAGKTITNTATISQAEFNSNPNKATATIYVPLANLITLKVARNVSFDMNDIVRFIIILINYGPNDATGIKVTDKLPYDLTFISASEGGVYNSLSRTITWNLDDLAKGLYHVFILKTKIRSEISGNSITNIVTESQNEYTSRSQTSRKTIRVNQADLYLISSTSNSNPKIGEKFIVTFKLGNRGPDTAKNVVIKIPVPEGLEFIGAIVDMGTWTYDPSSRTVTWNLGDVEVGDPYLYMTLKALKAGSYVLNPLVTTTTYDPNLINSIIPLHITVTAGTNGNVAEAGETVGMKNTGAPIVPLLIVAMLLICGLFFSRKK